MNRSKDKDLSINIKFFESLYGRRIASCSCKRRKESGNDLKNTALEQEILALSSRTGVGGSRVFEVDKSRQTKAVNAYVTGLFGSKRIVLWDTLLQALPPREVKAVVAHELGHYVLGHVRWGVLLGGISSFGGLFILDRLIRWGIPRFGPYLHVHDSKSLTAMMMVVLLITVQVEPLLTAA